MFGSLSLSALIGTFLAGAVVIWFAGIKLTRTTNSLAARFGLGEAIGGLVFLAVSTNLPEVAITASAAWTGAVEIATGNLLGGIAIQTVVWVLLDAFALRKGEPLSSRVDTLAPVLEGVLVIAVLTVAMLASQVPDYLILARLTPGGIGIAVVWVLGLYLISKARSSLPWHRARPADDPARENEGANPQDPEGTSGNVLFFLASAIATLIAGVVVEESGKAIADRLGIGGLLFGATFLAAATAMPQVSTGFAAVCIGKYHLAISDIFGSNAFLPVLFLLATLISGKTVLPHAQHSDIYLTALGMLVTCPYLFGLLFQPDRRILRMGLDSVAVLVVYGLGLGGLVLLS